jgi:hypothetical protein
MSSGGASAADNVAVAKLVEAVQRESAALAQAMAWARRVRLVVFLGLVIVLLVICGTVYRIGNRFLSEENQKQLLTMAQDQLVEQKKDMYMKQVQQLVDKTSPVLTEAFSNQVKQDMPQFLQDMQSEREILAENLRGRLTEKLQSHYQKLLDKQDETLRQEIEPAKNEETRKKIAANLDKAIQRLLKRYYVDAMQTQLETLYDTWDHFPAAAPVEGGTQELVEKLTSNLVEMVKHWLRHHEVSTVRARPDDKVLAMMVELYFRPTATAGKR